MHIMISGFPPRLENRDNEKCQGKVSEFDFGQNVKEMSGNVASNCDIYGKSPQFHEIILRICHTPACLLSVEYLGPIILPNLNLFLIVELFALWLDPQMLGKCSLVYSITSAAVKNIDMLWSRMGTI